MKKIFESVQINYERRVGISDFNTYPLKNTPFVRNVKIMYEYTEPHWYNFFNLNTEDTF